MRWTISINLTIFVVSMCYDSLCVSLLLLANKRENRLNEAEETMHGFPRFRLVTYSLDTFIIIIFNW